MRNIIQFCAVIVLSTASVSAQVAKPANPRTVSQVVDFWVTNTEQLVVPAADAMPEAEYSFAPSSGEFSGVRTFAEQIRPWQPQTTSLLLPRWASSRLLVPATKRHLTP